MWLNKHRVVCNLQGKIFLWCILCLNIISRMSSSELFFVTSCVCGLPFGFECFCLPRLLVLLQCVILQYYGAPSHTIM